MDVRNTLAYYVTATVAAVKSAVVVRPRNSSNNMAPYGAPHG